MPVTYTCNESDRTITWITEDPVTVQEWEDALDRAERDPLVRRLRPKRVIVDLRQRTAFSAAGTVRSLAQSLCSRLSRNKLEGIRAAFLVSNALGHGMVRMAGAFTQGSRLEFEIFRTPEEARDWLMSEVGA